MEMVQNAEVFLPLLSLPTLCDSVSFLYVAMWKCTQLPTVMYCADIDECTEGGRDCDANAHCTNMLQVYGSALASLDTLLQLMVVQVCLKVLEPGCHPGIVFV